MKLQSKVLDEIIAMLDEQEGEKLKKHHKLMAMQVEIEKKPKDESMEMEKPEMEEEDEAEAELSPEMIQKLLEMVK